MKLRTLLPILACLLAINPMLQAQENNSTEDKKVVIITKIVDENGVETTEEIILDGDQAEQHHDIKIIKSDGNDANIWITKDGETIELEGNSFEFDTDSEMDGNVRILKFSGDEEIDIENGENVDVDVREENGEKIITVKVDGKEKVIRIKEDGQGKMDGKKMKKRFIIIDRDDDEHSEDVEVIINNGMGGLHVDALKDIDPESIKNINVNTNDGVSQIEVELKDGKIIKKVITEDHHRDVNPQPFMGIQLKEEVEHIDNGDGVVETNSNQNGIVVDLVIPNSGAANAGIQKGDVITAIDGKDMGGFDDLSEFIRSKNIGDKISVKLNRQGTGMMVDVVLGQHARAQKFHSNKERFLRGPHGKKHIMHRRPAPIKRDPCKPFIGFYNTRHTDGLEKVKVTRIIPNTPAERHGLQEGDVILEMDGTKIKNHQHLISIRDNHDTGDRFKLLINRDGKKMKIKGHFNDCPTDGSVDAVPELNNAFALDAEITTEFQAFPNPSQGIVNVNYKGTPGSITIKVSDITGKVLMNKTIGDFDGVYQEELDFSQAAEGALILQIENGGETLVEKIIMQSRK